MWDPIKFERQHKLEAIERGKFRKLIENVTNSFKTGKRKKLAKVIANCKKSIEFDGKIGEIIRKFFDELELNEFVQETQPLRMMAGVMLRNGIILRMTQSLGNPLVPGENSEFNEVFKKKGFSDYDFTVFYVTLVVHLWLDQTEFFKKMLLTILNKKARKECRIKDSDTLGTLLNKLGKKIPINDFRSVMKPEFRNVLGHGNWWVQKDYFCYVDKDEKIIVMHKLEFLMLQMNLTTLTLEFIAALYDYHLMP